VGAGTEKAGDADGDTLLVEEVFPLFWTRGTARTGLLREDLMRRRRLEVKIGKYRRTIAMAAYVIPRPALVGATHCQPYLDALRMPFQMTSSPLPNNRESVPHRSGRTDLHPYNVGHVLPKFIDATLRHDALFCNVWPQIQASRRRALPRSRLPIHAYQTQALPLSHTSVPYEQKSQTQCRRGPRRGKRRRGEGPTAPDAARALPLSRAFHHGRTYSA